MPGDHLPSTRQLAHDMGVSLVTVREALRHLQGNQLIKMQLGRSGGAMVKRQPRRSDEEIREELRQQQDQLVNIFDFRSAVEPFAARLAAKNRTDEHLNILDSSVTIITCASERLQEATKALTDETMADEEKEAARIKREDAAMAHRREDYTFHVTIARAADNPYIVNTVERLRSEFFAPITFLYHLVFHSDKNQAYISCEHEAIRFAIENQDEDEAAEKMWEHIEATKSTLLQILHYNAERIT